MLCTEAMEDWFYFRIAVTAQNSVQELVKPPGLEYILGRISVPTSPLFPSMM